MNYDIMAWNEGTNKYFMAELIFRFIDLIKINLYQKDTCIHYSLFLNWKLRT